MQSVFPFALRSRLLAVVAGLCLGGALGLSAQEPVTAWADRETRLANEYLSLLVSQPEYGRVLDLLWSLYEKHDATALLLENVATQVQANRHPTLLLVQGHLLRRSGDLKQASSLYAEVVKLEPENRLALRAQAEVARELSDLPLAQTLLKKLADLLPDSDPQKPQAWIELGTVALAAGKNEDAAQAWERAAALKPGDFELARQVAELLLRAGFPDRAGTFYSTLAEQTDPQRRLAALFDLARILEHADQFAKADAALLKGLALLDFRDGRYADFFRRRVRLHERFGNLDDLQKQLERTAKQEPVQERALRDLARFFEITVDLDAHLSALRQLVKVAPKVDDYRWELVRALLDHEGAAEAAKLLDERLKGDASDLPAIVFLRCEADLRLGNQAAATARLEKLISIKGLTTDVEKQALVFAQTRALDTVIELILKLRVQRDPDKGEGVFELAAFYRARKDMAAADALLRQFTQGAANEGEQQRRLNDAAAFLATGQDIDSAIMLAREAVAKPNAGREELLRLADLLIEHEDHEEAVVLLDKAWKASNTDEDRMDVDERLFSVLLGDQKPSAKTETGTAGDFKLPDAFTGKGFASDTPTSNVKEPLPELISDQTRLLVERVFSPDATVTPEMAKSGEPTFDDLPERLAKLTQAEVSASEHTLFRAAWWAVRTEMPDLAYPLFLRLQTLAALSKSELPLEREKLLLDLALSDDNKALSARLLRRLMQRDVSNRVRYTLRLSELLMQMEQEATTTLGVQLNSQRAGLRLEKPLPPPAMAATALLEKAYREMPESDQLLSALSQCYTLQRRSEEALKLWKDAVKRATGSAAVPLMERYAELLLEQQKLPEYVEVQVAMVEKESDVKRRRDVFKRFLDRLLWTEQGGELAEDALKLRLDLVEKALTEQMRRYPFDGFYHEALAWVYERKGDANKAFIAMKQAYYTAPETPFSMDQLRDAALRVSDLKSAIYFQKQIAARAPPKDIAPESRRLVELLEQTFQIAEADRVRRRLESRFSQDAASLEDLAGHYQSTGQDEAERRVYEQIARVRPWDARSLLRIALKCLRLADDAAAEKHLREILAKTTKQAFNAKVVGPERLPLPLADARKSGPPAPVTEITSLIDMTAGLERTEQDRLRALLNFPRAEFTELPEPVEMVRLRAIEELARLMKKRGAGSDWLTVAGIHRPIEQAWALYYSGAGPEFRVVLRSLIGSASNLESQFCLLWLTLRSQGMEEGVEWAIQTGLDTRVQEERKRLLLAVVSMLADLDTFRYAKGQLAALGAARTLKNASVLEITRSLQDQQRYNEALELGEGLRRGSTALADDYAFFLARIAESAERWDLARFYLGKVVRGPVLPGRYQGTYDPYLFSLSTAHRLATSDQEREETLRAAWQQLQRVPDSGMTRLRKSAVAGLAGAQDTAAAELQGFITRDFISARPVSQIQGALMPQGSTRQEEPMHLQSLWEETREIQAIFVQQGLGPVVESVNEGLTQQWGGTGLSSRAGLEFGEWKLGHLMRELRSMDYPSRLRRIREHLATVDMRLEISVDTISELGGRLESIGMHREAIQVYDLLPGRAPANPEYATLLIRASEQALETKMGLKFTLQLLLAEPPMKPPQPGNEVLRDKHAHFLALDFDVAELHRRGFLPEITPMLQGRIPPEVPYLRELALLHERFGQSELALAAWERMHEAFVKNSEAGLLPDSEGCLHRGKLLRKMGRTEAALQALRDVSLTEQAALFARDALKLRAELLAETAGWEEFRQLMAAAVERKSLDAIAHLTELLRKHERSTEALNFLTQAERSLKDEPDRFRLRLELLRLLAHDPAWTPERGRGQVAALFRVRNRDRDTLRLMMDWMHTQAKGTNREAWIQLLRSEARAGTDRSLAALALTAFAADLPESGADDIAQGWASATEGDRLCVELGAETLLAQKRPHWAWRACLVIQDLPSLRLESRRLPLMLRVAHALEDRALISELFSEVIRMPFPGGNQPVTWAQTFVEIGETGLARELFEAGLEKLEATQSSQPELSAAWVRFLIQQGQLEAAETYLLKNGWSLVQENAKLIFELYQAWGKLPTIELELPKHHLAGGIEKEVLFLTRQALGQPMPTSTPP